MPLYEYECESCGVRFERIQKFSDPPPAACPTCGGPIRKLLSSPAIQFKGSGFYITDYGKGGSTEKGGAKAPPSGGKDASSESAGSKDAGSKDSSTKDAPAKDGPAKESTAKDTSASKDTSAPSTSKS